MIIIIIIIIIIVILKIIKKKKKNGAACNKVIFISAIYHGQWYFTSYILQKIIYFFHNHISQSAERSLSF